MPTRIFLFGFVIAAACGGETAERRSMRQMAGTYSFEDTLAGALLTRTMTLSAEGKATMTQELTLRGQEPRTSTQTGTYTAREGLITTRFENVPLTWTILGDTLFPQLGARDRQIEAMTGHQGGTNMGDERLVRVR
jgi:hypothetical protein